MGIAVDTIDIYNPDNYVEAPPHAVFEFLRREHPIWRQEMPDGTWYWAVLKHADVVHVSRNPLLFSAQTQSVVLEDPTPESRATAANMLLSMDPPRHTVYRRPLSPEFRPRVIAGLEPRIRAICREIMVDVARRGTVEFVHEVTSRLPSQVIGELMGLPEEDWAQLQQWAEMNTSSQDPDIGGDADSAYRQAGNGLSEMGVYGYQWALKRREEEPREDLTSLILETEFAGHTMTEAEFATFFVQLVTAGNDTTKSMLSGGLATLLDHPEQLAALRADYSKIPGAVEEILRYANPLHYFRRTLTADTEMRGVRMKAGEKLAMIYTSANRDEDVFDDPHRFDISRNPNPHLAFGIGEHFCLGVHLARLEGRVFLEEFLSTFREYRVIGEPKRIRSNLNNAMKELHMELVLA